MMKVVVYEFLCKGEDFEASEEWSSQASDYIPSAAKQKILGLDCIHEFHPGVGEGSRVSFWACSACYSADTALSRLPTHLSSDQHRLAYIMQYFPQKRPRRAENPKEFTESLDVICQDLGELQGDQVPEVLVLKPNVELRSLLGRLGVDGGTDDQTREPSPSVGDLNDNDNSSNVTVSVEKSGDATGKPPPKRGQTARKSMTKRRKTEAEQAPQSHSTPSQSSHELPEDNKKAPEVNRKEVQVWCQACWQMIPVNNKSEGDTLTAHYKTSFHEKKVKARSLLAFVPKNFVSGNASSFLEGQGWKESQDNITAHNGKLLYPGLEDVILSQEYGRDEAGRSRTETRLACLLCPALFPSSDFEHHVASAHHILQYFHKIDPEMARKLSSLPESERETVITEYMKSHPSLSCGRMRTYSPPLARLIESSLKFAKEPEGKAAQDLRTEMMRSLLESEIEAVAGRECGWTEGIWEKLEVWPRSVVGAECVYGVETEGRLGIPCFLCGLCPSWETEDTLLPHLDTEEHQMNYLKIHYKDYWKIMQKNQRGTARQDILKGFADSVERKQGRRPITHRLALRIKIEDLQTLWPMCKWKGSRFETSKAMNRRVELKRTEGVVKARTTPQESLPQDPARARASKDSSLPAIPGILDGVAPDPRLSPIPPHLGSTTKSAQFLTNTGKGRGTWKHLKEPGCGKWEPPSRPEPEARPRERSEERRRRERDEWLRRKDESWRTRSRSRSPSLSSHGRGTRGRSRNPLPSSRTPDSVSSSQGRSSHQTIGAILSGEKMAAPAAVNDSYLREAKVLVEKLRRLKSDGSQSSMDVLLKLLMEETGRDRGDLEEAIPVLFPEEKSSVNRIQYSSESAPASSQKAAVFDYGHTSKSGWSAQEVLPPSSAEAQEEESRPGLAQTSPFQGMVSVARPSPPLLPDPVTPIQEGGPLPPVSSSRSQGLLCSPPSTAEGLFQYAAGLAQPESQPEVNVLGMVQGMLRNNVEQCMVRPRVSSQPPQPPVSGSPFVDNHLLRFWRRNF